MKYIEQEIKIHSSLSHPNVIGLYQVLREGKFIHLLLEYASKGSLFDYTRRNKSLNEKQIVFVFLEICKGMEYIHSQNILHRDLKPENILFDENFIPKLADFGFACEIKPNERRKTICGTKEYFSPEIFTHKPQSLKLDVWCMGVLLFELCHGKTPFHYGSSTFQESAEQIRSQKYKLVAI